VKAFKGKVREKTRRSRGDSLERIIADLNQLLRGWFGYFKHVGPSLFRRIDQIVRRRLRAVPRKQDKRPSMGRSEADQRPWTNAFFADQRLFTLLRPMRTRDTPDEETSDWRAVCGKTASTARRARRQCLPDLYRLTEGASWRTIR
jgi:hypothetical protein